MFSFLKKRKPYTIYSYLDETGKFDYEKYVKIQTKGNKDKINQSWIDETDIQFLGEVIKSYRKSFKHGICHGTRKGLEQKWFSNLLNAEVIGTEISDSASQFENTIQWDFHELNEEWVNHFDFVYSNSLDHAYDPQKALSNWMKTLTDGGICILEHSKAHDQTAARELDPFGVALEYFPYLILKWSEGKYSVRSIHTKPGDKFNKNYLILMNNF